MGDANANWGGKSEERNLLKLWSTAQGYDQLVQEITRPTSGSTIDLTFGRGEKFRECRVVEPGLSDHRAVVCKALKAGHEIRQTKMITMSILSPELIQWARDNVPSSSPSDSLQSLYQKLREFVDNIICRSEVKKRVPIGGGPRWFTPELKAM